MHINRFKLMFIMLEKNIKTADLAKLSGVSTQTISNIRNGKSCSLETAAKLAKVLQIAPEDLVTD